MICPCFLHSPIAPRFARHLACNGCRSYPGGANSGNGIAVLVNVYVYITNVYICLSKCVMYV